MQDKGWGKTVDINVGKDDPATRQSYRNRQVTLKRQARCESRRLLEAYGTADTAGDLHKLYLAC